MTSDDRRVPLPFPLTTGVGADILGTTEPRLSETVRRGHVKPPPPILAGRRLWSADHLLQAAEALGVDLDEVRERLNALGQQQPDDEARQPREGESK